MTGIDKALDEIDEEAYNEAVKKLAERKWASLKKETNKILRLQKTKLYLMQRGYERSFIERALQSL